MRVLIVKMSSLGDVVHLLPALTDAHLACPDARFDWVVETGFAAIPAWHPAVDRIVPIDLRGWRSAIHRHIGDWRAFQADLRTHSYDLVLDAQGLIKSAIVALLARGACAGFDRASAREPLASICYERRFRVRRSLHAVDRLRALFAQALEYALPLTAGDYGLMRPAPPAGAAAPYVVLLHGASWPNKRWPLAQWRQLARHAADSGLQVRVPCMGDVERQRATAMVEGIPAAQLLVDLPLTQIGAWLAHARGVVGVDTGLAHLAAAFGTPTLTLHGPTDTLLTGVYGGSSTSAAAALSCVPCGRRVCAIAGARVVLESGIAGPPCMAQFDADRVWRMLGALRRSGVAATAGMRH